MTVPLTKGTYATCSRARSLKIVSGWMRGMNGAASRNRRRRGERQRSRR